ncbi:MAG: MaoC family dehydratase [Chloroflexi bacterium]|nr:MaoC family dehydratase [Chloroflexota bacterium]
MARRYFEDFVEGQNVELGTVEFTAESMIEFACEFDPQAMHTDPAQARQSIYGGLIASGWHTAAAYMRMLVDAVLGDSDSIGSPGIDNLRWLKPVRPGDSLRGRFTVLEAKLSRSRPDRGIVRSRGEMLNQQDEIVMQLEAVNFFGRRPGSA